MTHPLLKNFVLFGPPQHQYVSQCMTEIKKELKGDNLSAKANAISKLTYVSLMHGS